MLVKAMRTHINHYHVRDGGLFPKAPPEVKVRHKLSILSINRGIQCFTLQDLRLLTAELDSGLRDHCHVYIAPHYEHR